MNQGIHRILGLTIASVGLLAAGCSPPKGESTGRVESTDTTKAERRSSQVSITALTEQSDQVAEQLAADLNSVPEFNGSYRSTVVFGDIVNKTQIVPTSDFEAFRTKIRNRLMQSQSLRNKMAFVENRARVEELRRREGGGTQDLLQQGAGRTGVKPLNEEYTYFLNGEMYRVDRGSGQVNLYSMSYNLTKMSTGEIIWTSPSYEVKQVH
jgi:PBP1b-binding outer membrane lipoprotein LpoB